MPKVVPYEIDDDAPTGTPELVEMHYDVWNLRISLDFPDWSGVVYVDFESPLGFRVMEESDLLEMWDSRTDESHWLNRVKSNGWLDQEARREGFTSETEDVKEYLVVGVNDCVSVMAFEHPTLTIIDAND